MVSKTTAHNGHAIWVDGTNIQSGSAGVIVDMSAGTPAAYGMWVAHGGSGPAYYATPTGTSRGLYIDSSATGLGSQGIYVNKTAGAAGIQVAMSSATTGVGLMVGQDGTGRAAQFTKDNASGYGVSIQSSNVSNTDPALYVTHLGTSGGPCIQVSNGGAGNGIYLLGSGGTHAFRADMDLQASNKGAAGIYINRVPGAYNVNNYGLYVSYGSNNALGSYGAIIAVSGPATNLWVSKAGPSGGSYTALIQQDSNAISATCLTVQADAGSVFNFGTSSANLLTMDTSGIIKVGSTGNAFRVRQRAFGPETWQMGTDSGIIEWQELTYSIGIGAVTDGFTWRNLSAPAIMQIPLHHLPDGATLTQFTMYGFHNTAAATTKCAIVRRTEGGQWMWDNTTGVWQAGAGWTVWSQTGPNFSYFTLNALINGTGLVLDQQTYSYAVVFSCSGATGANGASLYMGRAYYRWDRINM
jgi:hypothetical protein